MSPDVEMVSETAPWSNQSGCLSKRKFPSSTVSENVVPPKIGICPEMSRFPVAGMPILAASASTDSGSSTPASSFRPLVTAIESNFVHCARVVSAAQPYSDL